MLTTAHLKFNFTHPKTEPANTQIINSRVRGICSEEFFQKFPESGTWLDIAVERLNRVLMIRNEASIDTNELYTTESDAQILSVIDESMYGTTSLDSGLNIDAVIYAPYYLICENDRFGKSKNTKEIYLVLTDKPLISMDSSVLFGGAVGEYTIVSMSHIELAIKNNPKLIKNSFFEAVKILGLDTSQLHAMTDTDYILREGFIRLVMHEFAHTQGIPVPEGSNDYDRKLYHDEYGVHCNSTGENARTCIMNQASDVSEWFTQFFTERLLGIDFCDVCCKV